MNKMAFAYYWTRRSMSNTCDKPVMGKMNSTGTFMLQNMINDELLAIISNSLKCS